MRLKFVFLLRTTVDIIDGSINITSYLLRITHSLVTYVLLALVTGDKKQYNPSPTYWILLKSLFVCLYVSKLIVSVSSEVCSPQSSSRVRVGTMCRKAEKVSEAKKIATM